MKKIHINELSLGMTVLKADKSWLNLPFFNSPIIEDESIDILKSFKVEYLYIDANASIVTDTNADTNNDEVSDTNEFESSIDKVLEDIDISNYTTTLVELAEAKEMFEKAKAVTKSLYQEVKLGKALDTAPAKNLIQGISSRFFKKPHVLTSMTRLKSYDDYTFIHSVNVSILCIALGKQIGLDGYGMQSLGIGGLLLDIGKMKIPDSIINKPGKLTEDEYKTIQKHPEYGFHLLEHDSNINQEAHDVILQHHERADGSGYPYGLKDSQISKFGRIASIVDVYDAITSDRVYHASRMPQEAIKIIYGLSGCHFNTSFVKFFIDVVGIYPVGTCTALNTGELAIIFEKNSKDPTRPKVIIVTDTAKKSITPYIFDLSSYHLISKKFYKGIIAPLDARGFNLDTNKIIDKFISKVAV